MVENFSRANPDQKGAAAEFYEQSGFPRRAEQAYRAFVAQNAREPLRELALAGFLGRQNRTEEALTLCENAWKTCPPEPVAATSVAILAAGKNVSDEQDHRVEGWLEFGPSRTVGSPVAAALHGKTLQHTPALRPDGVDLP